MINNIEEFRMNTLNFFPTHVEIEFQVGNRFNSFRPIASVWKGRVRSDSVLLDESIFRFFV